MQFERSHAKSSIFVSHSLISKSFLHSPHHGKRVLLQIGVRYQLLNAVLETPVCCPVPAASTALVAPIHNSSPSYTTPISSLSGLGSSSISSESASPNSGSSTPDGEYGNELSLRVFSPASGEVLQQSFDTSNADSGPGRDRPAEIGGDIEWKYAHQGQ